MYRWVDHTAEIELQLEAASKQELFEQALVALGELLSERSAQPAGRSEQPEPVRHSIDASAPDGATLLAEWLSELVYLVETEGLVPQRVDELALADDALEASVSGRRGDPPHLVKAVTYHRLEMEERDGRWRATVVLDV